MKCKKEICKNNIRTDKNCNLIIDDITFNCDYIQVFILKHFKDFKTVVFVKESRTQEIIFNNVKDGFYTICKLTIPLDETRPYYYKDGKYYHNAKEVYLQEIINTNPEITQVQIEYFYYFSTCNLKKCFINTCQDILSKTKSICNKQNVDNSLIYKRDLLWTSLNVIKYMVEIDQMEEAQRLLDQIVGCNGLCPQYNVSDCGCN